LKSNEITEFNLITAASQTYFNNLTTATQETGQKLIGKNQSTQGTLTTRQNKTASGTQVKCICFDEIYRKIYKYIYLQFGMLYSITFIKTKHGSFKIK